MAIYTNTGSGKAKVEGLDELLKACKNMPDKVVPYMETASLKGAKKVLARAKAKVLPHRKTGALLKSLKVNTPKRRNTPKYKYNVFSRVYFTYKGRHGVPLELGHRIVRNGKKIGTVKEKPFLRPAADESTEEVMTAITEALNKALEEFGD